MFGSHGSFDQIDIRSASEKQINDRLSLPVVLMPIYNRDCIPTVWLLPLPRWERQIDSRRMGLDLAVSQRRRVACEILRGMWHAVNPDCLVTEHVATIVNRF